MNGALSNQLEPTQHLNSSSSNQLESSDPPNGSVSNIIQGQREYILDEIQHELECGMFSHREVKTVTRNGVERKLSSPVWLKFHEIIDENSNIVPKWYYCLQCKQPVENKYPNGTTVRFIRHLKQCTEHDTSQLKLDEFFAEKDPKKVTGKYVDMLKEASVRFVCEDLRPYSAIEGRGVFELIAAGVEIGKRYPNLTRSDLMISLPSRDTVHRTVEKKSDMARDVIGQILRETIEHSSGFACTLDLWSDDFRQKSYLAVTAHTNRTGNDAIKHDRLVIEMKEVPDECKTKEVIEREVFNALTQYGITEEQIKNNVEFVTDRGPQMVAQTEFRRSNCYAHLLNNVVEEMCKEEFLKPMIEDATKLVKYMKKSGLNHTLNVSLKSFSKTRWSTVYYMFKSIVSSYGEIFEILEKRHNSGKRQHRNCLDRIECLKKSTLQKIVEFLEPFKDWTDRIEGDKDVTIHHVWPIFIQMNDHIQIDMVNEDEEDTRLIEGMKVLARNYISKNHSAFSPTLEQRIAVVLNPQMKKLRRMTSLERDSIYASIDDIINTSQTSQTEPVLNRRRTGSERSSLDDFIDSDDEGNVGSTFSKEFNDYLAHKLNNDRPFNLRRWWFENRDRFPVLFKLFMKISAIPASSAPSERTFSITGAVISDRRSSLLPKSVSDIIICRNLYMDGK